MSDEQDKLKVSLEPPKLFGRKKKQPSAGDATAKAPATPRRRPAAAPPSAGDTDATTDAVAKESTIVEPEPQPTPTPEPTPERDPAPETADPDATASPAASDDTVVIEPDPADVSEISAIEPVADAPPSTPVEGSADAAEPAMVTAPAAEAVAAPAKKTATKKAVRPVAVEPEPVSYLDLEDAEIAAAARADDMPLLERYPAAALTGGIVGVAAVALTWLFLRGCEAVRGTASCGGGPGFLLLLVTFAACVVLGSALLKTFSVREPGTTSFLAAGVVAAISLTFLVEALDDWPIIIVVPLLSVAAYLGSVKLTDLIDETADSS